MGRLDGKVAIVLGGGQRHGEGIGNGRAISVRFAEEGASVMIVARHMNSAMGTVECIKEEIRDNCFCFEGDISNENDVERIFQSCIDRFGSVDVVVNNVGLYDYDESFLDVDMSSHERMMDNNVNGALYCFRQAHKYMKKGGSIVQISSVAGSVITKHKKFSYAFSKHSMTYLGEQMAASLAEDGIRVNNVILGLINTPVVIEYAVEHGMDREKIIREREEAIPLKGVTGNAWDTANAALFLASDESRFITGANLPVDGGLLVYGGRC